MGEGKDSEFKENDIYKAWLGYKHEVNPHLRDIERNRKIKCPLKMKCGDYGNWEWCREDYWTCPSFQRYYNPSSRKNW